MVVLADSRENIYTLNPKLGMKSIIFATFIEQQY